MLSHNFNKAGAARKARCKKKCFNPCVAFKAATWVDAVKDVLAGISSTRGSPSWVAENVWTVTGAVIPLYTPPVCVSALGSVRGFARGSAPWNLHQTCLWRDGQISALGQSSVGCVPCLAGPFPPSPSPSTLQQEQGMPSGTVINAQCHVWLSASAPALCAMQI